MSVSTNHTSARLSKRQDPSDQVNHHNHGRLQTTTTTESTRHRHGESSFSQVVMTATTAANVIYRVGF